MSIIDVKNSVEPALFKIPGVVGVGVGPKFSRSRPVGEIAIVVFVERKVPLDQLDPAHVIPSEIQGFKTDVSVAGRTVDVLDPEFMNPRKYRRDEGGLRGGITIVPDIEDAGRGTLGCLAIQETPAGRAVFAITCAHVVNDIVGGLQSPTPQQQGEQTGQHVGQPTAFDSSISPCCTDLIGTVPPNGARYRETIDAAVVRLDAGLPWVAELQNIGTIGGTRVYSANDPDIQTGTAVVSKYGARTLYTRGLVRSIDFTASSTDNNGNIVRTYKHALLFFPVPPFRDYVQQGDSGSASVDHDLTTSTNRIVGINFGGVALGAGATGVAFLGAATPITNVEQAFDVSVATSNLPGDIQTVPKLSSAPVAGLPTRPANVRRSAVSQPWAQARRLLESSEAGRSWIELMQKHQAEVRNLITTQPRVAAIWNRRRGGYIASRVFTSVYAPEKPIFDGIAPESLQSMLDDILEVVARHASPSLRTDLDRIRPMLQRALRLSHSELVRELSCERVEPRVPLSDRRNPSKGLTHGRP